MRWFIRAILLFSIIIGSFILAERLVVYPLDPRQVPTAEAGVPEMKEIVHRTIEGIDIVVWTSPPRDGKPTILYLHGNAGNLTNRAQRFNRFLDRGYGLVAPAYRGSSGTKGWPSENYITRDMNDIYSAMVAGSLTGRSVRPIIYGESIGAAVAVQMNISDTAYISPPRGIILEAPFTSLKDVARDLYPELQLLTGLMRSRWNSLDAASEIKVPLMIAHGVDDPLIPIEHGRALFEAVSSEDKTFIEVTGAGHVNVWTLEFQKQLFEYLTRF